MVVCAGQDVGDGAVQQAPHDRLPEMVRLLACPPACLFRPNPSVSPGAWPAPSISSVWRKRTVLSPRRLCAPDAAPAVGRYPYSHIEPQPRIYPYEPRKPLGECYICCNISDVCTGGTPGTRPPPHASSRS